MKVLKFGGSSILSAEHVTTIVEIIIQSTRRENGVAVVFSALNGVTDDLIAISRSAAGGDASYKDWLRNLENRHFDMIKSLIPIKSQSSMLARVKMMMNEIEEILHGTFLIREVTPKSLDFVVSFGERLCVYIITGYINLCGTEAEELDARELVKTDNTFGAAKVDFESTGKNIGDYFKTHRALQVITGFIGSTPQGETTTLGRGGSDYTASLFSVALGASEIEIWKDIDGVMTADPRKVPEAFSIDRMTYAEAMEMSYFGAKVLFPPTIQPALEKNIPIRIKNVFNPAFPGTVISTQPASGGKYLIKGISSIDKISLLRVEGSGMIGVFGIAGRLFSALARAKINIILISQASSEHSICFAIRPSDAVGAKKALEQEFVVEMKAHYIDDIIIEEDLAIIAIVGEKMRHTPGIAARLFQTLFESGVNVVAIAQGSSELNISIVVAAKQETRALQAMHTIFFKK